MTARTIRESWDGGTIAVDTDPPLSADVPEAVRDLVVRDLVWIRATERGAESALLTLTGPEVDDLIAALQAARAELATETAPDPTAEPGRPITHDSAAYRAETAAMLARHQANRTAAIDAVHEAALVEDDERAGVNGTWEGIDENARAVAAVLASARAELLANSTPVHVHEEWTECRHQDGQCCSACHVDEDDEEDRDPVDDMTEPDEPIGNVHGGNYYESAVQAALRGWPASPAVTE